MPGTPTLFTNTEISELLAREADRGDDMPPHRRKAFKRASRAALSWPRSASELILSGESLSENLRAVGPYLSSVIRGWMEEGSEVPHPPPLRRGFRSFADAQAGRLSWPNFLPPLYGDLHVHSEWSDGKNTLWELAMAAEERGYSYLAVTDHAAKLPIAGGLKPEVLERQGEEIRLLNERLQAEGFRCRLLWSSELNISATGEVDYEPELLSRLDITIAACHSKLRVREDQTPRLLAAVENPHVDVLAHPRCRIYNHRGGLKADWRQVLARIKELDKALEIDGFPDRQDADPEILEIAAELGVYISLGSDTHRDYQLDYLIISQMAALEAGVTPDRILNTMNLEELRAWKAGRGHIGEKSEISRTATA